MNNGPTVLLIGSGPIQIGQAAEFDYSGTQACRALREEGARVVLVNSNPATIMTDPETADEVYIEPITPEIITEIIKKEDPDGIIAGLGGQTGLNVTAELAEQGILDEYGVELMGTPIETIYATEDRESFRERMVSIDQPVPISETVQSVDEVEDAVEAVGGLPVIMRTAYTLGGSGSGVIDNIDELKERVRKGIHLSRNNEVQITQSIVGWIELEYEVMRDGDDSTIIVCNMENIDPMGIHTGESTVVTPSQIIPDDAHQEMRSAALDIIRELGVEGGCNIQFAWHDDGTPSGEYMIVEVNPRVSRSSALASKATGYPIARVAAKISLGKRLDEIENEITGETTAAFEPAIDYIVTKIPRWPKDKFREVKFELTTAMKSTGEAMAIGRTFQESLLKALRSSDYNPKVDLEKLEDSELKKSYLETPTPDRSYAILEAFTRGYSVDEVSDLAGIHTWYLERYKKIAEASEAPQNGDFVTPAEMGFTNKEITELGNNKDIDEIEERTPKRTYKQVDTCAGEFAASTPYYYSARESSNIYSDEIQVSRENESVVIVGGGPIRIGQGIEFDYCTVHAVRALKELGIDAYVVNNNPETVSTDYDTSDGLFFEPITAEEIADIIGSTNADGVMVQFGGQTSVDVARPLEEEIKRRNLDCEILGTSVDSIDLAENRDRFNELMEGLGIEQPDGGAAASKEEAISLAEEIGYPVLVRPSYVLGGRAMEVVENEDELLTYIEEAAKVSPDQPVLVDEFIENAVELDVDAVSDGEQILMGGIMEHVESAGVHSGDSACVIPPRSLDEDTMRRVREVTEKTAKALNSVGLLNVQLAVKDGKIYMLEANPRSSRTVPFVSKATDVPIAKIAAKVMAGVSLDEIDVEEQIPEKTSIKEVVLPFDRLPNSDPRLAPEMKSTGEVMGTASSFGKAYEKAQQAINRPLPENGVAIVDLDVEGLENYYDIIDFDNPIQAIRNGEVDIVFSRNLEVLQCAVEEGISYFSTEASANAVLESLRDRESGRDLEVVPIDDRPKTKQRWG